MAEDRGQIFIDHGRSVLVEVAGYRAPFPGLEEGR